MILPSLKTGEVFLPNDAYLRSPTHLTRLALMYLSMCVSRREFPDLMAEVLFLFEGQIIRADGTELVVTDTVIDDAFGDDGSFRWMSVLARYAIEPPKRRANRCLLPRLEVLSAFFLIAGMIEIQD